MSNQQPQPENTPHFGQSPEGIDRAEALAEAVMEHFVLVTDLANLDTTIAATFLVAELLADLQVRGGVEPEALVAQFRHLIDQRAAKMAATDCPECRSAIEGEAQGAGIDAPTPATVH